MVFEGQITKVFAPRTGTSQRTGNEWKSQSFIFEYFDDNQRHADSVVLETFNTKYMEQLIVGNCVKVGFSHDVHEHEGRYFNELRVYSLIPIGNMLSAAVQQQPAQQPSGEPTGTVVQPQQQAAAPAPQEPQPEGVAGDDLPF